MPPPASGPLGPAPPPTLPPLSPPLWLRVQPPDGDMPLAMLDPAPWATLPSTTVWVCPAAAAAAGLEEGTIVAVAAGLGPRSPRAYAALALGPPPVSQLVLSPGHAFLPPPLARVVGVAPRGRVALVRAAAAGGSGGAPCLVVLRPDRACAGVGGGGEEGSPPPSIATLPSRLASLPPRDLAALFASWLAAQARAGPGGGGGRRPDAATPLLTLPPVVLADGALARLAVGRPPEAHVDVALELHWPAGGRKPGRPVLLTLTVPALRGEGGSLLWAAVHQHSARRWWVCTTTLTAAAAATRVGRGEDRRPGTAGAGGQGLRHPGR